jgi:hypothetical protein
MSKSRAHHHAHTTDARSVDARLDEAVQRLWEVLAYEGAMRRSGHEFLDAVSAGLDRHAIVRRAAERWRAENSNDLLSLDAIAAAFRADLARLFGWDDGGDAEGSST